MADHSEQGSLLGKIAAYTELLDKDPCSTIFVPLSDAYRQMEMLDEAVDVAKRGIMENPAFPGGYVAYGRALIQQGMIDEAVAEFEKALILDRKNLAALKGLAKLRMEQGGHDEARKLLDRAHGINPDDDSVNEMLSALAKQAALSSVVPAAPESATAPSAQEGAAEKAGDPISTATIAEIYIRQGFPEKALKVYRDLLRADPQNADLRQKLVALKERIQDSGSDAAGVEAIGTAEAVIPGAAQHAAAPDNLTAETVRAEPASSVEPVGRSIVEVFAGWLDSISRRREAHVR
ncbi:tetratricopeptide repeat protein [Trichloromonas sp.]|uniref:tetratricopeptide repeat protein n=1 Tax=Trichloromonas sp. TaxID=3069249 RepID=UPI003D81BBDB